MLVHPHQWRWNSQDRRGPHVDMLLCYIFRGIISVQMKDIWAGEKMKLQLAEVVDGNHNMTTKAVCRLQQRPQFMPPHTLADSSISNLLWRSHQGIILLFHFPDHRSKCVCVCAESCKQWGQLWGMPALQSAVQK